MHFFKRLYIELYVLFYNHFWSDLRIENPKVDYPILILSFFNLFLLTFVYVTEFFLSKSGISTPNELNYGDAYTMIVGYIMVLTPAYLITVRSAFAEQMDVGSGLVSRFICIGVAAVFSYGLFNLIAEYAVFIFFLSLS